MLSVDTLKLMRKVMGEILERESCDSGVCDPRRQPPFYLEEPMYVEAVNWLDAEIKAREMPYDMVGFELPSSEYMLLRNTLERAVSLEDDGEKEDALVALYGHLFSGEF